MSLLTMVKADEFNLKMPKFSFILVEVILLRTIAKKIGELKLVSQRLKMKIELNFLKYI